MIKMKRNMGFVCLGLFLIVCLVTGIFYHSLTFGVTDGMVIPDEPPMQDELLNLVSSPSYIDTECDNLGIPARLMNFNLATTQDLTDYDMGICTYIPVAITTRTGGRKSLYYLANNEEVLAGIFVNSDGYAKRYVKRISGTQVPAEEGDEYEERWVNFDESILLYKGSGELDIIDFTEGHGEVELSPDPSSPVQETHSSVWILWSCIKVDKD